MLRQPLTTRSTDGIKYLCASFSCAVVGKTERYKQKEDSCHLSHFPSLVTTWNEWLYIEVFNHFIRMILLILERYNQECMKITCVSSANFMILHSYFQESISNTLHLSQENLYHTRNISESINGCFYFQ